ncbi:MAG TPA: hypothetical protein VD999_03955 [Vitreimonas sp.]|nr:hypothetical protein [Vitreimonas sp.]
MIFPIWQPLGSSSHRLAEACGRALNAPATHTGTLDPMAEGVLVILAGDDRFAKGQLQDWQKTYHFSILWGVATDSLDRLGLITTYRGQQPKIDELRRIIEKFPAQYSQSVPAFSAARWQGQSHFELAKGGSELPLKTRDISLHHFHLHDVSVAAASAILSQQSNSVQSLAGDFRQSEILDSWEKALAKEATDLLITTHSVTTSPGTYIRQLVQDVATHINIPATTWSITRTANGPYDKSDCVELDELAFDLVK